MERLLGGSEAMEELRRLAGRAALASVPVLVRGETGAGKDIVARAIHEAGARGGGPFIVESLAAIPSGLLESELLGHAEGAFSGATRERSGRISEADGGTLYLSEVDELPLEVQAKLVRVLETREVRPLGSSESRAVDFRVITSARSDLRQAVAEGQFRADLYYRIRGLEIVVPPLRERREDIPALVERFLSEEETRFGERPALEPGAMEKLAAHDWPGNVRELENEVRRLSILGAARIRAKDVVLGACADGRELGVFAAGIVEKLRWDDARRELDRAYLEAALKKCGGRLAGAARILGIHERSVYKLRRRLGLE
jgi:two-component system response regulator GlrR